MKHMALCAVLAAGCTTEFSTDDGSVDDASDTGGDTPGDTPGDAPGDTPADVIPDAPLPEVGCRIIRDVENTFSSGVHVAFGCDTTSGECLGTAIWIMELGANLIVIHGSEDTISDPPVHLSATMLGIGDLRPRTEINIIESGPYETQIRGGTVVERTEDWNVLLVPAVDWLATGGPSWNIRRVVVAVAGSDSLAFDEGVLLEPGVPESMGQLLHPRGVHLPGSASVHVLAQLTDMTGWETNRLYGATLTRAAFEAGGLAYADAFHPMQPDMSRTFYTGRPDVSEGALVVPFMELDSTEMTIRSGLWAHRGSITPGSMVGTLGFEGTRSITANVAGRFIAPGTYASAAVTTNSPFEPEEPLAPPYQINSAVIVGDELDGTLVGGTDVFGELHYTGASDFNTWDITDTMVLHDPTTGFHFYVMPMYEDGVRAFVGIFPMREDGSAGGEPLIYDTGQSVMPAFDATINPETGAIYLARHMETGSPDDMSNVPGFVVTEISCPLAD